MSNGHEPVQTEQDDAPSITEQLAVLPPRVRVHVLAKLLQTTSKELLVRLREQGEAAASAQSSVSREVAQRIAANYLPGDDGAGETTEVADGAASASGEQPTTAQQPPGAGDAGEPQASATAAFAPAPMFLPPDPTAAQPSESAGADDDADADDVDAGEDAEGDESADSDVGADADDSDDGADDQRRRRRRGRRGRGRGKGGADGAAGDDQQADDSGGKSGGKSGRDGKAADDSGGKSGGKSGRDGKAADDSGGKSGGKQDRTDQAADDKDDDARDDSDDGGSRRRRRRRRRKGGGDDAGDDPPNTVTHVRDGGAEAAKDQVRSVRGSTRLEAKRQRRRDGREAGRRKAPVLSESEFLARRESVERTMVVKESSSASADRMTQIGVLEDGVLVEHFVTSAGSGSIVGNVYLGRVQNVLPSMEAAFVDIGRGRNAVLYAGEVDWDAAGLEGKSRKIEQALSTGDLVMVQVTKDPVGHKGARLTTQISLPGRFLVYVPSGGATGISRKLPENERRRLKDLLKKIVPADAGVIIRTASEGITAEELERDVRRLQSQWEAINEKADKQRGDRKSKGKGAPTLLYEEPDLLVKVVRDLFTEDFSKLVVQGSIAWETIDAYVRSVAPDLADRLERYTGSGSSDDVFVEYRIDEQITKALDRKVWLPSGGYLVIDRTEAMTVIDVNTGKFTGSGGNLEETVTRNNLESAEEIVRQLRLRDIGGIIVIDFIDMVLESNRDLVLRRLTECLSRDRTRHQVAEVTSLGLVQMTRKRVGTGLLEAYSSACEHCKGRGVLVSTEPQKPAAQASQQQGSGRKRKGKGGDSSVAVVPEQTPQQRESVVSAVAAVASASRVAAEKPDSGEDTAASAGQSSDSDSPDRSATTPAATGDDPTPAEADRTANDGAAGAEPSAADATTDTAAPGGTSDAADETPESPASSPAPTLDSARRAHDAEQVATAGVQVTEPAATEPGGQAEAPTGGSGAAAGPPAGEEQVEASGTDVPDAAARSVRTRTRRSASRPAGPPVGAANEDST